MTGRAAPSVVLTLAALLCGYLFLAGFEYPGATTWKLVTGTLGVLFFAAAMLTTFWERPR